MAAYHVNPATGKVGQCSAVKACRFGTPSEQHYSSEDEARAAYEKSMEGYAFPTEQDREVQARREQPYDWEDLSRELDADTAKDLYWDMRDRSAALMAKAQAGTLAEGEGKEVHDLDHEMDMMRSIWEARLADSFEHLDSVGIRQEIAGYDETVKQTEADFRAKRKANEKLKPAKQESLDEDSRNLHSVWTGKNARAIAKARIDAREAR